MKLLIITQRVDLEDSNLGFFHRWIEEFAKNCEAVTIIAQFVGEHRLPSNVRVFSLGKEHGFSKSRQLFNFYRVLGRELKNIDVVFVHMIPLWVVLGAPFFKIYRKPVYLWYVHRSVTLFLRIAEKIVTKIFTASRESFRLSSKKVEIVGHGIDTEYFVPKPELRAAGVYRIMTAGRISESKRIKEMVLAIAELRKNFSVDKKLEFVIVGGPRTLADESHLAELKGVIYELGLHDTVYFRGDVPYLEMSAEYQKSDLFLNFSLTGSVDKAVLEAMACGVNILVANDAFFGLLPEGNILKILNVRTIAANIQKFLFGTVVRNLRELVVKENNITTLIERMIRSMRY